jgi:hypothetical protein
LSQYGYELNYIDCCILSVLVWMLVVELCMQKVNIHYTHAQLACRKQVCDLISAAVVLVADHFRPPMPIMSSFSIWWRQEDLKSRLPANLLYNNLSTRCLCWKRIHVELKTSISKTTVTEFRHICEERERSLGFPPGSIVSVRRASSEVTPLMCCPHYDSTMQLDK